MPRVIPQRRGNYNPRLGKGLTKLDPTRTGRLRRMFSLELRRRFSRLFAETRRLVEGEYTENIIHKLRDGKWRLYSHSGKNLGTFDSREAAVKHEQEVQYFKHANNLASTQFNVDEEVIVEVLKGVQSLLNPDDVVELETQPHITVRYGLQGQETEPVQSLYRNTVPIRAKLGGLSLFPAGDPASLRGGPKYDVLKIDVESRGLSALHQRLGLLPNTSTHPIYHPHLTVAYLKPGTGIKYVGESGLEGTELTFDRLVFSNDEREYTALENAFCPTGPGGGQDNSCSSTHTAGDSKATDWVNEQEEWKGKVSTSVREIDPSSLRVGTSDISKRTVEKYKKDILNGRERSIVVSQTKDGKFFVQDGNHYLSAYKAVVREGKLPKPTSLRVVEVKPNDGYHFERVVDINLRIDTEQLVSNAASIDQRVNKFMKRYNAKVKTIVKDKPWWVEFVNSGFQKGAGRAYDDVNKSLSVPQEQRKEHIAGKRQFLKSTAKGSAKSIRGMYGKVEEDLDRITLQLGEKLRDCVEIAVAEGERIKDAVAECLPKIEAEGLRRAENVARYRTIEAHTEGQLAAFEELGVEDISVMVEWTTTGNPCPMCAPMEGAVLRPQDAHGLIPRHVGCLCGWEVVGSDDGVDEDDLITDRSGIRRAIKASIQQERRGKGSFKRMRKETMWGGADVEIDDRPLFNTFIVTSEMIQFSHFVKNAFCPTGPGGGQDNSCSSKGSESGPFADGEDYTVQKSPAYNQWIFKTKVGKEIGEIQLKKGINGEFVTANLLVWPEFQRQGWATKFYENAARWAQKQGKRLFLSQVISKDARKLHEALRKAGHLTSEGELFPKQTRNQFCPTGQGGGVDPTCSPSSTTKGGEDLYSATRGKDKVWRTANGEPAPEHIQKLGIPPAWKQVEINPDPNGTTLAKGVDAKGRAQTRYSNSHTAKQAAAKFGRTRELIQKREQIYKEIDRDAKNPELKEEAECLKLVMQTGMRPGSDKDTKADHKSYGASTLEGRHVFANKDGTVTLRLVTGKNKGREVDFPVNDKSTASMLKARAKAAGKDGRLFRSSAEKLRDYSKSKDGGGFKTKDHRTALGTETALRAIKTMTTPRTMADFKNHTKEIAVIVSKALGNTPPIALKSYIDPQVFAAWNKGLKK